MTLATSTALETPFLTADSVHAALGRGILVGRLNVTLLEVARARIALVRNARGMANWPASDPQATSTFSGSVNLGHVRIPDLDVAWHDARAGLQIDVAGLSLHLEPNGRETSGPLRMSGPGRIQRNDRRTSIEVLEGRLSWNGRDLSIDAARVVLPEGQLRADGRVEALLNGSGGPADAGRSRLNLRLAADANLLALSPWAELPQLNGPVEGSLQVVAAVTGFTSAPEAVFTVTGRDMGAAGLQGATRAGHRSRRR